MAERDGTRAAGDKERWTERLVVNGGRRRVKNGGMHAGREEPPCWCVLMTQRVSSGVGTWRSKVMSTVGSEDLARCPSVWTRNPWTVLQSDLRLDPGKTGRIKGDQVKTRSPTGPEAIRFVRLPFIGQFLTFPHSLTLFTVHVLHSLS